MSCMPLPLHMRAQPPSPPPPHLHPHSSVLTSTLICLISTPQLGLWAAALINPLPVLGVAPEVRMMALEATESEERAKKLLKAIELSLAHMRAPRFSLGALVRRYPNVSPSARLPRRSCAISIRLDVQCTSSPLASQPATRVHLAQFIVYALLAAMIVAAKLAFPPMEVIPEVSEPTVDEPSSWLSYLSGLVR